MSHFFLKLHSLPLLKNGGEIRFKTDNDGLFEFTLKEFEELSFEMSEITRDLHSTATPNIMTEYEKRFSDMGVKIKRLVAKPTDTTYKILTEL